MKKSAIRKAVIPAAGMGPRGTLFLESEPMSLDMLADKTGYSKTTVRSNMKYLENLGMVVRVVGPVRKQHRYKLHRYSLVTDAEAMRPVILSAANDETHTVLNALNQIEKNLKDKSIEAEKIRALMVTTRKFYEDMNRIYTLKELIEILESKKK